MKKISGNQLGKGIRSAQLVLANALEGASLVVPYTSREDSILVPKANSSDVLAIRTLLWELGLPCANRSDVHQYDLTDLQSLPKAVAKKACILPAEYGSNATLVSEHIGISMSITGRRSNKIDHLHIDDISKVSVSTVRQAHAAANYLLGLVPNTPGLKLTADNGKVFETKNFQEFDAVVRRLLATGKGCFIGISKELGKVTELSTAQLVVGQHKEDDAVISVVKKVGREEVSEDLSKWSIPDILTNVSTSMRNRGYQGFVRVTIGKAQRGDKVPAVIRTGFNPQLAAAYTVAKVAIRDAASIPHWALGCHPLGTTSLVDAIVKLHKAGLLSVRNQPAGVVPLSLVSGRARQLHYVAMAGDTTAVTHLVQRVRGVL